MDEPQSTPSSTDGKNKQDRSLAWTRILSKQPSERKYRYLDEDEGHTPSPIPITIDKPSPIGWDRVIELVLTGVIAYASSVQLYTVIENNKSTSVQSERLLQSANRIDDAADSFSSSASKINGGVGAAVVQLQAQAEKMDAARTTSEAASKKALDASIEASREEQRAWVVIKNVKLTKPLSTTDRAQVTIFVSNTGKTPALEEQLSCMGVGFRIEPLCNPISPEEHFVGTIAPESLDDLFVTFDPQEQRVIDAVMSTKGSLYLKFTILYYDVAGRERHTSFCGTYPGDKEPFFTNCQIAGKMD